MNDGRTSPTSTSGPTTAADKAAARTSPLLEGPIVTTLLRLAAPNLVVNIVLIAVTATVDAYFIARLGSAALAGLSLVFPIIMLLQQVANSSMGGAVASAVARAIGAGRHDDASALVVHALVIAAGMAALFSAVLLLGGRTIYALMGGGGETLAAAVEYSNAIFAGALAYWVLSTLTSVVRGAGQATVLALVYVGAEILHIALVPLLMFGLGPLPPLGIAGAGLATVLSFAASSAFLAWYIVSGRTAIRLSLRDVRMNRRLFVEILRVGAPMSLQPLLYNFALAMLTGYVALHGAAALAGFGVAVRLEYLVYPLAFSLGAGLLAMVGTNIGAGNRTRAARIAWTGAALAGGITGAIGLLGAVAPVLWTGLFTTTPEIDAVAARYMAIIGLAFPFLGAGLTLATSFQAAGRPLWPLLAVTGRVIIVVGGGWLAVRLGAGDLTMLGLIAAAALVVYGVSLAAAFRSGIGQGATTPAPPPMQPRPA